jgi:hypothetical protein
VQPECGFDAGPVPAAGCLCGQRFVRAA